MIAWGTLAGALTGLATLIGAIPILFAKGTTDKQRNAMLGFAAGVMLSASYLSLIVPAADVARENGHSPMISAVMVAVSVLIGAASLHLFQRRSTASPQAIVKSSASPAAGRRAWLLIVAMTSHNLPEGAAVGVSFGAGNSAAGITTALGIGIQNLPEGLAVAAALLSAGVTGWRAVLIAGATGIVEPVGAFLGSAVVVLVQGLLPVGMGWAAGAMLYIVAAELLPAVHTNGNNNSAIGAFVAGLCCMLFLDLALG